PLLARRLTPVDLSPVAVMIPFLVPTFNSPPTLVISMEPLDVRPVTTVFSGTVRPKEDRQPRPNNHGQSWMIRSVSPICSYRASPAMNPTDISPGAVTCSVLAPVMVTRPLSMSSSMTRTPENVSEEGSIEFLLVANARYTATSPTSTRMMPTTIHPHLR